MNVICYGDSNTYGYDPRSFLGGRYAADSRWVDILGEKTGWNVVNDGMNGRCIPCEGIPIPENTDLLILMLGTNDLLQGGSPDTVADRMKRFLGGLTLEKQRVLLIAPPPMEKGEWVQDQMLIEGSKSYAVYCRDLAAELGIRFADAGAWNISMAYDGVHFAEKGHSAFAEGLYKELIK